MQKRDVCAVFRVMFVCCYRRDPFRRLPPEMLVRVSPVPPVRPVLGPLRVDVFFPICSSLLLKKMSAPVEKNSGPFWKREYRN